jgi:hypothetical protein
MTDVDFLTRLEHQLSEAERVQELGSRARRSATAARGWAPPRATLVGLVAAAAALVVAIAVGAGVIERHGTEAGEGQRAPKEVARLTLSNSGLADIAAGFGSTWIGGYDDEVVRLDATTRRVITRIYAGPLISGVVATADAVWVVVNPDNSPTELLRIDPRTNRVVARVPVAASAVDRGVAEAGPALLGSGRELWLLGADGGARIDPRSGRATATVAWHLPGSAYAEAFALNDDALWVRATNGWLLRFDPRDGTRTAGLRSAQGMSGLGAVPGGDVVISTRDGTVTRLDGATGRTIWTARLPGSVSTAWRTVAITGDVAWVLRDDPGRAETWLVALDLSSGRTLTSRALLSIRPESLVPVGKTLWFSNASGQVVVVRQ